VTYPSISATATCCALAAGAARKPITARASKKIAALFLKTANTFAHDILVNLFCLAASEPEAICDLRGV
jgi:hypothetical protein